MYEVIAMKSADGETVKLTTKVLCELGVEEWLKKVESRM